ncbi:MAG TPA: NAD(P)-dependent oxidoreductase [Patescibacteria group bacterium]|nr:NAD(P)-dependent oxidoreductase [Patescibacteria group bacterium]
MKTVLITGGAGFLGVHLSRFLLKRGYKVICLDIADFTADDIKSKITYVRCDIRNKSGLLKEFKGIDYIVHAAAALPIVHAKSEILKTNVDGTRNVLDAALKNKIKRVVFISSTALYGVPKNLPETETDEISPIGNYGESKMIGEELCLQYFKRGLSINIVRPKTFLGPERLGVFTLWFEAIYQNKPVFILGDGNNLYQLLDVTDLCDLLLNALLTKKDGEIFNAGASVFSTWRKDLGALIKHAKSKSKIIGFPVLPSQLALGALETFNLSPIVAWHYKTLPVNSYVSTEKSKKYLNFKPKKGNQDIFIESYDWYKKHREEFINKTGTTHRTIWNFKLLDILNKLA